MAGIDDMLGIGRSALGAHQRRILVTQNNVANASVEGYRRQRVDYLTLGGQLALSGTSGVSTFGPTTPETFTSRSRSLERGAYGYSETRADLQSTLQNQLFPPEGGALQQSLDAFFEAARALEGTPKDGARRREFLARAESLAGDFNQAARTVARERESAASQVGARVEDVNRKLDEIAKLDARIRETGRSKALDMVARRDQLAQEVSEMIGAEVFEREDGTLSMVTASGRALVEGTRARPLTVNRTAAGGVEVLIGGGASEPAPLEPIGGRVGGMVDAVNEGFGRIEAQLDQLAFEFSGAVNAQHSGGFGLDGNTGRDLFDAGAAVAGAAGRISVSADLRGRPDRIGAAQAAGNLPGGNRALQGLIDVSETALPSGRPPGEFLDEAVAELSSDIATLRADAQVSRDMVNYLDEVEASRVGVSLEEELIAMTETQRAYQASLKILDASRTMFDTILSLRT